MTKKQKEALYKCNVKDLISLMNDPKYRDNKGAQLNDIVSYIARFGMKGTNVKGEVHDLIYAARDELIAQEAKEHMGVNYNVPYGAVKGASKKDVARIKAFINNPVQALHNEFTELGAHLFDEEITDIDVLNHKEALATNLPILDQEMRLGAERGKINYGSNFTRTDVMNRLMKTLPAADKDVDETVKRINGGWLTRLFRKPSKEYKEFEDEFNLFREAGKANSGDIARLEKKTTAYLKHIIPDFTFRHIARKEDWLNALPSGKRERAELCMNVLGAINDHKKAKPYMENTGNSLEGKPFDKDYDKKQAPNYEGSLQEEFQNKIIVDMGEEEKEVNNNIDLDISKDSRSVEELDKESMDLSHHQ